MVKSSDSAGNSENLMASPGPVMVWMNGGGTGHWITLRLEGRMAIDGTGSNADAIGARAFLTSESVGGDVPGV